MELCDWKLDDNMNHMPLSLHLLQTHSPTAYNDNDNGHDNDDIYGNNADDDSNNANDNCSVMTHILVAILSNPTQLLHLTIPTI